MADPVVHVIDDDEGVRTSLHFLLETAGLQARTYASAIGFLDEAAPEGGCIVTDVRMPDMTGLELIEALKERGSALPVLVISGHGDIPMAVAAMKAGAVDFLEKPFSDDALIGAIKAAFARDNAMAEKPEQYRLAALFETLTPRERDVLRGLVAGGSNKSIGLELDISPRTVEVYRGAVMVKTGASSLADLVRMSMIASFA